LRYFGLLRRGAGVVGPRPPSPFFDIDRAGRRHRFPVTFRVIAVGLRNTQENLAKVQRLCYGLNLWSRASLCRTWDGTGCADRFSTVLATTFAWRFDMPLAVYLRCPRTTLEVFILSLLLPRAAHVPIEVFLPLLAASFSEVLIILGQGSSVAA
jgi:hypothetical protein